MRTSRAPQIFISASHINNGRLVCARHRRRFFFLATSNASLIAPMAHRSTHRPDKSAALRGRRSPMARRRSPRERTKGHVAPIEPDREQIDLKIIVEILRVAESLQRVVERDTRAPLVHPNVRLSIYVRQYVRLTLRLSKSSPKKKKQTNKQTNERKNSLAPAFDQPFSPGTAPNFPGKIDIYEGIFSGHGDGPQSTSFYYC
jgi:hypothetical protein